MNPAATRPALSCFTIVATAVVTIAWLVLLVASLLSRPTSRSATRLVDRLLMIASVLMLFGVAALLLTTPASTPG